jgi:hypothetical protein
MKKHLSILAIIIGLAAPIAAQAGPGDSATPAKKSSAKKTAAPAAVAKTGESRTYYYITKEVPTGSNIPIVVRRNGTETSTTSVVSTYTKNDLERTGAEDIAGELVKVDPAIMLRR